MKDSTLKALKWIINILNINKIPYRLGGGTAAYLYRSGRTVNDIDISIDGNYFQILIPKVEDYIISGPEHYINEKWDCDTLSLKYNGQEIDLTDVNTLLMKSSFEDIWIKNKDIYNKWPNLRLDIGDNIIAELMHPRVLLEYKRHLDGDHQEYDRQYLKKIIEKEDYLIK